MTQTSAEQRSTAFKNQLVQALADLATLDEQREALKNQIAALRNFLAGINHGENVAREKREAENAAQVTAK